MSDSEIMAEENFDTIVEDPAYVFAWSCTYQLAVNDELDHKDSAWAKGSESEVPSPKAPEISAVWELMNNDEDETVPDIFQIMKSCLKDIKKLDMPAVTQYVQLRDRFHRNPHCTKPCLNASLVIARCMGKANGAYFAR